MTTKSTWKTRIGPIIHRFIPKEQDGIRLSCTCTDQVPALRHYTDIKFLPWLDFVLEKGQWHLALETHSQQYTNKIYELIIKLYFKLQGIHSKRAQNIIQSNTYSEHLHQTVC